MNLNGSWTAWHKIALSAATRLILFALSDGAGQRSADLGDSLVSCLRAASLARLLFYCETRLQLHPTSTCLVAGCFTVSWI